MDEDFNPLEETAGAPISAAPVILALVVLTSVAALLCSATWIWLVLSRPGQ